MDDDYGYTNGPITVGSGIIVECGDKKYIGYYLGSDETYLHFKATHFWAEVNPEVSEESKERLRGILEAKSEFVLRVQASWKYKTIFSGLSKAELVELLMNYYSMEAVYNNGPVGTFVAEPQAVTMGVTHMSVDALKSLEDVMQGRVLSNLDFTPDGVYNDKNDDNTDRPAEAEGSTD